MRTATAAERHEIARRLATRLVAASAPTSELRPYLEAVRAIYFHALSDANSGWTRVG